MPMGSITLINQFQLCFFANFLLQFVLFALFLYNQKRRPTPKRNKNNGNYRSIYNMK